MIGVLQDSLDLFAFYLFTSDELTGNLSLSHGVSETAFDCNAMARGGGLNDPQLPKPENYLFPGIFGCLFAPVNHHVQRVQNTYGKGG